MSRLLVVLGVLAALPGTAFGQICSGSVSFARGPFQVFGSASFNDDAKSFGGGFAFGGAGAFGQLSGVTTTLDEVDGSAFSFGGGGGYQISLDRRNVAYVCPTAGIAFTSGPNDIDVFGDGSLVLDFSGTELAFGVAVGVVASRSGKAQIIPAGSLSFANARFKAEDQVGNSESDSESYGILGLGVGFVFNEMFTLHPGVLIPFGLEGASTTFGLALAISFGQRRQ